MNLQTQTCTTQAPQETVGYPEELCDGLITTIPNALQGAILDSLCAIHTLSYKLGTKLPAHTDLLDHLAKKWPIFPASLPPQMETALLDALRQLNTTRLVLQTTLSGRAAEADGYWFDGKNHLDEMSQDVWEASAQYRIHHS